MRKSTRWLSLITITTLILMSLLGGIVSALAGSGEASAVVKETVMAEGTEGTVPEQETALAEEKVLEGSRAEELAPQTGILCERGEICVIKFLDVNENEKMDEGETGLSGVTINLNGGTPKQTVSDGKVCYDGLEPGKYTVSETVPAGYHATTQTSYTVDIYGDETITVYFGNVSDSVSEVLLCERGSISGHKWRDYDWDGEYDTGEPGMAGVPIELWKDGYRIASTTTTADGSYVFADLEAGLYTVTEIVPVYMVASSPASVELDLGEGENKTGVDFFNYCATGVVEVLVFEDTNCNGILDGEDTLFPTPVKIQLYHVLGGGLVPADGYDGPFEKLTGPGSYPPIWWPFPLPPYPTGCAGWNHLPADDGSGSADYLVKMVIPEGWSAPGGSEYGPFDLKCIVTCSWQQVKFLLAPKSHVTGYKYEDKNCSGKYDAGDIPVEGIPIELWKDGVRIAETKTDENGFYIFDDLEDGIYTIKEVLPSGWYAVEPDDGIWEDVQVGCGDIDGLNFLNARDLYISGHKYEDTDGDGEIDPEDPGVTGVEVQLFAWNENSGEYEYVASTLTGAGGYYEFTDLKPGKYKVMELLTPEQLEEWYIVIPEDGVFVPVVLECESVENLDFLNARYGAIEGWKYWDKDENGIMDGEDEGLAGVTIILDPDPGLGAPQVTITDDNGYFFFGHLKPGKYTVRVDESTVPDYYPISPFSVEADVTSGQTYKVYFSEAPYGSISGKKWLDADHNGIWGEDETVVIEGITINLYAGNPPGELIATTVTGEDGYYKFTHLKPGVYTVEEEGMKGYFSCTPVEVSVVLSAGEGAVVNFGNCPLGRVEGLKFDDLDGDGSRDANEPALQGVEITLEGLGDIDYLATMITGEDGTFIFEDLKPGSYMVSEKVPAGYYATRPIQIEVAVGPGESIVVIFANSRYGKIIVNKWLDDGDTLLDREKDTPKAGMPIKLTGETLVGDLVSMETKTEEDGSYTFLLLEAGEYNVTEFYDATKMMALTPDSVDVTLTPGGEKIVDFLNVEVEVSPEVIKPETLPVTGMNQLPLLIAAGILLLAGLACLALGLRRRYQE